MTKLLDRAIKQAKELPADMQDEIAGFLLRYMGKDEPVYQLTQEERKSFARSLDQARRREFATEAEVSKLFSKYKP